MSTRKRKDSRELKQHWAFPGSKIKVSEIAPHHKLLLSAKVGAVLETESKAKVDALTEMTGRVVTYGDLGGLAVYDIEKDYYHFDGNYVAVRTAIQTLNPSR